MGTNYYAHLNDCCHCDRYDELHIGKSSGGWRFFFRAIPDHNPPLTSWAAWQDALGDARIFDEYGRQTSLADLRDLVAAKFTTAGPDPHADYHDKDGHPFHEGEFS